MLYIFGSDTILKNIKKNNNLSHLIDKNVQKYIQLMCNDNGIFNIDRHFQFYTNRYRYKKQY